MTESTSATNETIESTQPTTKKNRSLSNFLLGAFFGIIPVGFGLDMSSFMTHTPLLDFAVWKLAIALNIPVMTGILGVVLKGKFLRALEDVLISTTL